MDYINNFGKENWQLILLRTKSKFLNYDIKIKSMFEFLKTFSLKVVGSDSFLSEK